MRILMNFKKCIEDSFEDRRILCIYMIVANQIEKLCEKEWKTNELYLFCKQN